MGMGTRHVTQVALYPDLNGEDLRAGGMADRLLAQEYTVVALLNGNTQVSIGDKRDGLHIVRSPHNGLAGSLPYGYEYAMNLGEVVLRIDTNEHPMHVATMVADQARACGAAVGDPVYGTGTLAPHTPDELAQLDVFPALFRRVTGGALGLTGSHGLQAWSSEALERVLPAAKLLFEEASGVEPLPWGFDAAMVLAGLREGVSPTVVHYEAPSLRNRGRERIASQFDCVLRVCLSYSRAQAGASLPNGVPNGKDEHGGCAAEQFPT